MSPIVATYFGLVVAVVIVLWAVTILVQRVRKQKRAQRQTLHTLVPFNPTSVMPPADPLVDEGEEDDEETHLNHHSRAQQNGHYLGSKKHP